MGYESSICQANPMDYAGGNPMLNIDHRLLSLLSFFNGMPNRGDRSYAMLCCDHTPGIEKWKHRDVTGDTTTPLRGSHVVQYMNPRQRVIVKADKGGFLTPRLEATRSKENTIPRVVTVQRTRGQIS